MAGNSLLTATSVLAPKNWPFRSDLLPPHSYLVGGIVRDALLGRCSNHLDLDFVMPERAVETAQTIARHYQVGYVLLDAERQIARVVFPKATIDFAQQVGDSLETDLKRRDFTVNAMAYDSDRDQLIDPLGGYQDLQYRQLRMVSPANLEEDPLRLLRAYRQAAQLNFSIEPDTQVVIRRLAHHLGRMAAERVQAELSYLIHTELGTPWLRAAWQDHLLQSWFPHSTLADVERLAGIDQAVSWLTQCRPELAHQLNRWIRDKSPTAEGDSPARQSRRTWLSTAKLACLMMARPTFARPDLTLLKCSRAEIQAVTTLLKNLGQFPPNQLASLDRKAQYNLFQGIGAAFPAFAVLSLAAGIAPEEIMPLLDRYLTPDDPVAHPTSLLTGQELMTILKLPPGPRIGRLLASIQLAQAEGKVQTPDEAIAWATNSLNQIDH